MTICLSEQLLMSPVVNPATGGTSRTFRFAGRCDLLDGGMLIDWKTGGDPHAVLDRQLLSYQGELYSSAVEQMGLARVDGIQYRIVKTPSIKLCQRYDDMDPAIYEERCLDWLRGQDDATLEHECYFNPARLQNAREWLWRVAKSIMEARNSGMWLQNSRACGDWGRKCPYMPLCLIDALGGEPETIILEDYEPRPVHEELAEVGQERDILTYSAASTYVQCEALYYWRYVRAIRRRQDESGEAAYVGSAVHAGMDAYAHQGLEAALDAVNAWVDSTPAIGAQWQAREAQAAKARAMVRIAAQRWPSDAGEDQ